MGERERERGMGGDVEREGGRERERGMGVTNRGREGERERYRGDVEREGGRERGMG